MAASVSFILNGEAVEVANPDPMQSLLSYIRDTAKLKGTKGMCFQGGCGSCTVLLSSSAPTIVRKHQGAFGATTASDNASLVHRAANACLTPLCAVNGMAVTTVEGVGSVGKGLHAVQREMRDHNASQCGYCTSGFVSPCPAGA